MLARIAAVLVLLVLLPAAAQADKRVALVVGNSAYQHTPKLANPKNDATDVSVALKRLGFQVIEGFDLDKAAFERKVRDFATALQGADAGVLFYAGHGLQVAGQNYLVPIDAAHAAGSASRRKSTPFSSPPGCTSRTGSAASSRQTHGARSTCIGEAHFKGSRPADDGCQQGGFNDSFPVDAAMLAAYQCDH